MKRKVIWLGLSFLILAAMLLASCSTSTTTSTSTSAAISTPTSTPTSTVTSTPKSTTITTSVTTTTAKTGNWWDKLGKPQYGGTMTIRYNQGIGEFDPYQGPLFFGVDPWFEQLTGDDWTLDPAVYDYTASFRPAQYVKGWLATSWEMPNPSTYVVHLRQGVHWQNIPPVNGRELVADDVVYTFDRLFGLGDGFTKPGPGSSSYWVSLTSVVATDKYTVTFNWNVSNPESITDTMQALKFSLLLCHLRQSNYGETSMIGIIR